MIDNAITCNLYVIHYDFLRREYYYDKYYPVLFRVLKFLFDLFSIMYRIVENAEESKQ